MRAGGVTGLAGTEQDKMIHFDMEVLLAGNGVEERLHRGVANLLTAAAAPAHQVMVRLLTGNLVNRAAIAHVS